MIFNSLEFAIFLPAVFLLSWFVFNRNVWIQNLFIVLASYFFYGWWNWRYPFFIAFTTVFTYLCGIWAQKSRGSQRKIYLITFCTVLVNVAILFYFKYFNFFVESFASLFSLFGKPLEISALKIILPVGISFYTFQAISYTIDIYREKAEPAENFLSFAAFMCFFPKLLAGPIDRATGLLPQFYEKRQFDYPGAVDGMRQMLWGFFKKMVIADNCALCVNQIFPDYGQYPGSTLLAGVFLFTIQIYCDFSGYSDIALGTARLFGLKLHKNFDCPFFARDIAEFWRRWHISLTAWLTDYIFMPLTVKYRDWGKWGLVAAILVTFLVSGFWHGSNWTFVIWGVLQGCFYIPLILNGSMLKKKKRITSFLPPLRDAGYMAGTFCLFMLCNVFYRSDSLSHAFSYFGKMFSPTLFAFPAGIPNVVGYVVLLFPVMLFVEWLQREKEHALQIDRIKSPVMRICIYYLVVAVICIFSTTGYHEFIYTQF